MSKVIKQMELDALKNSLQGFRQFVLLTVNGLSCQADHHLRAGFRKKGVKVQMVKNSLARLVFDQMGIKLPKDSPYWVGTTWMTFGPDSVAELSREVQTLVVKDAKLKDKVKIKGAIAEGQPVPFETALLMPTRAQAIAEIVAMIIGPGGAIAGALSGPAAQVASQVQKISEKEGEAPATPEPGAPAGN
jgi:large subunit ribosomal protein L10